MTVGYNLIVSNSSPWALVKILLKWRGSIWKAVWVEVVLWLFFYFSISLVYKKLLSPQQKLNFEDVATYLDEKMDYIPLNFMLGFFVSEVVRRWGILFNNIGLLDNVALMVAAHIKGKTEQIRMIRRNIVRYCCLAQCLLFRDISMQVRKRFPTLDTVVVGRFMMQHEKERFESISNGYAKYWMPFQWAISLANEARSKGACESDIRVDSVVQEIKTFRTQMATLCNYDWVPLPVMYPQLVFLAVHTYFLLALVSRQFVNTNKMDTFFPMMSVIQLAFYLGWMKVAEALLNPMGEDDDDFECNWLLDRNLRIALSIVDDGYECTPELIKDDFWENDNQPLYSTNARPIYPMVGSTSLIQVPESTKEIEMVPLDDSEEVFDIAKSPGVTRRPSRSPYDRKVSIVNPSMQNGTGGETGGVLRNIRKRLNSRSSSIMGSSDWTEKGAHVNHANDETPSVELGKAPPFDEDLLKDKVNENPADSEQPHEVISETITEESESELKEAKREPPTNSMKRV